MTRQRKFASASSSGLTCGTSVGGVFVLRDRRTFSLIAVRVLLSSSAFHCSWFAFFNAFFIWFAITPLLGEIRTSLNLTPAQVWTSSIVGVGGTIFMRFVLGPLCDKYGARVLMAVILCAASIPTAMTGVVNTSAGLAVLRLFIGISGGTFVMCQYWTSRMFTKQIVGTANAIAGGWVGFWHDGRDKEMSCGIPALMLFPRLHVSRLWTG
jgi:hypothetical protein